MVEKATPPGWRAQQFPNRFLRQPCRTPDDSLRCLVVLKIDTRLLPACGIGMKKTCMACSLVFFCVCVRALEKCSRLTASVFALEKCSQLN